MIFESTMIKTIRSNKKLTVLQMLPDLDSGGVERGTLETGKFLVKNGHTSLVVSNGGRMVNQLEKEGSSHFTLPVGSKSLRCLPTFFKIRRIIKENKVDILHLRSRLPAWIGYLAWKSLPANLRPHLLTTFHGFYSVNRYSAIMAKGEKIIAVSRSIKKHIIKNYNIPEKNIIVIPRGFDEDFFCADKVSKERVEKIKQQWKIAPGTDCVIVLPGRVTKWKGHDVFLNALHKVKDLKWYAICVGPYDEDSTFVKEIKKLCHQLGLPERVFFMGHCSDMPAVYLASDIAVSASSTEPEAFGRVAVEAQAMACPVIATAHGGSLETVIDGQTGWLVKPNDADSLAAALHTAITNPTQRRELGYNARQWVLENFTTEKMCSETLSLYSELVTEST
jgi:glycosyltransferase involved in cell wall biosynthesis